MHHQKFNKNWKNQEPPNVDWSDSGWSCGWPIRVDSKSKQKWKKNNYKIMERIALDWGKTQKREKPISKSRTNIGKNWKNKKQMPLRTWVPIWWVIFWFFWNGKE
jgi:hypothetical protein